MSLTQIYCISAERWGAWTLSPHWRYSICLMSLAFLIVSIKWLIDSIRRCPNKPEGYSIREERLRTQRNQPSIITSTPTKRIQKPSRSTLHDIPTLFIAPITLLWPTSTLEAHSSLRGSVKISFFFVSHSSPLDQWFMMSASHAGLVT